MVELMLTVAILGVLSTIMVPMFNRFQCRAKTAEAKQLPRSINSAYIAYYNENGNFPDLLTYTDIDLPGAVGNQAWGTYYHISVFFGWSGSIFAAMAQGYESQHGSYYILYARNDPRNNQIIENIAPCQQY